MKKSANFCHVGVFLPRKLKLNFRSFLIGQATKAKPFGCPTNHSKECAGGVDREREKVRGAKGRILGGEVWWLAEIEVSSAKIEVKKKRYR